MGDCHHHKTWYVKVKGDCLDSFGKEVSGLTNVFGDDKGGSQLGCDVSSRVNRLQPEAKGAKHGKTAVLDFLKLFLFVLFRGVVKLEGVGSSLTLSKTKVTWKTVSTILADALDTVKLDPDHSSGDLFNGKDWNVSQRLSGVGEGVSVDSRPFVSGEGSEGGRPDESKNSKLGNASVGDLGLAKPFQVAHGSGLANIEPAGEGSGGETHGVETGVSDEGSIQSLGGADSLEGKSLRWDVEFNIEGSAGALNRGRSKGGGRSDKKSGNRKLHG